MFLTTQSPRSKIPNEETTDNNPPPDPTPLQTRTPQENPPPDPTPLQTDTSNENPPTDPTSLQAELFTFKTRQAKAQHHLKFLETSLDNDIIPKGFCIQLTPQVMAAQDTNITHKWNEALTETSKKLMMITHAHYTNILENIQTKIDELEAKLSHLELTRSTIDEQNTRLRQLEDKLENTRKTKIDRLMKPRTPQAQVNNRTNNNEPHRPPPPPSFLPNTQRHQQKRMRPRRTLLPTPEYPPPYLTHLQPLPSYNTFQHYHGPAPPPLMSLPPAQLPLHLQPRFNMPQPRPLFPNTEPRPLF